MESALREKILAKIKPSLEEDNLRKKIVDEFVLKLKESSKNLGYKCDFFIGGSFGKETYLKGSSDVDIFASFDISYDDIMLSSYVEKILIGCGFKYVKQKGSRDYFSVMFERGKFKIKFEIVPNRKISEISQMINSTDVSPMHVDFLKKKISRNKNLCDEIRLAKQFFKAKKLYGSESYIQGFSGHVIDILIAYYGSLEKLLLDSKTWGEETFIDINKFYKDFKEAKKGIEEDKLSKLVVVDPILKNRNAARALSDENYYKFLMIAQNFNGFSENDFNVVEFDLVDSISKAKKFAKQNNLKALFYIFDIKVDNRSEDIVGSKLLKLNNKFKTYFESYDFVVFRNDYFIEIKSGKALFVFFFEKCDLAKIKKVKGPYVHMKTAVANFTANKNIYFIEDDRVYSYEYRKFLKVEEISNIKISDCTDLIGKDISFIKKMKIMKV